MKRFLLIMLASILLFSCDHNVYIDDDIDNPKEKIWRVESSYFETANEAIDYIISASIRASKTDDASRMITLMRPVLAPESDGIIDDSYKSYVEDDALRCSIIVPESFSGDLCIDFNGYRYDFSNSATSFFEIRGGDNVYIYNGVSVIFNDASHEPYAIAVNTDTVTIDEHLVDDRRTDPKALDVKSNGSALITSSKRENTALKGSFNVAGKLSIENGIIYIEAIETSEGSSFSITGGEIHNPHDYDSIVLPAIDNEKFEENGGVHEYIHEWSTEPFKQEVIKAPSCIETGIKRVWYKCTGCDATTYEDIVLDKTGHDHSGAWNNDSESHWKLCPVCGNVIDKDVHSFTAWSEDSDTIWRRSCTVCNRAEEDAHKEHKLVHYPYKASTCIEDGNIEYWHCTICDKYFSDEGKTEITKDKIVIPHHIISDEWDYDIDKHWHLCTEDGNKVDVGEHSWGEWQEYKSGTTVTHHYAECMVCGARKIASKPDYLVYNIGIGEVKLENIGDIPCGDFLINGEKVSDGATVYVSNSEVTAEFKPYLGSNTSYKATTQLGNNGWKEISGVKDSDGNYSVSFTLSRTTEYIVNIQLNTGGGNLGFSCSIRLKK